jgi:hypothetical protein
VTAVWPSGAKTTFWTFLKPGDDNITTLRVPPTRRTCRPTSTTRRSTRAPSASALKAQLMRDQARNSARCQAQQQSGVVAGVDDCK